MRLILLVALVLAVAPERAAWAYPQFQFSTGSDRCGACHLSPVGGGLLNEFGRSEAADAISWGGDGRFLHGAWTPPDALALGGNFRLAGLARDRAQDATVVTAFPMQADLHARVTAGPISLTVTGGLNGAARARPAGAGIGTYLASREHFVMYQREPGELYVRAGRFYPVLGLRSHDHSSLARRAIDHHLLDEPYAIGAGTFEGSWEAHVSAFAPNPLASTSAGVRAYGATAFYEHYVGNGSIAGQARFADSADDRRILIGAVGKWWLAGPGLLLFGELDLQHQAIAGTDVTRVQTLASIGATKLMLPGLMFGLAAQSWDPDLRLGGTTRSTAELSVQLFPWAHVEVHVLGRAGVIGGRGGSPETLAMVQLHYFL